MQQRTFALNFKKLKWFNHAKKYLVKNKINGFITKRFNHEKKQGPWTVVQIQEKDFRHVLALFGAILSCYRLISGLLRATIIEFVEA